MLTDRMVASTNASLKSNATIWSRIKKKVDWDAGAPPPSMSAMGMAGPVVGGGIPGGGQVMRQRFLTLFYGDMETIKNLPASYAVCPYPLATRDRHSNCHYSSRKQKQLPENGSSRLRMRASTCESPSNTRRSRHRWVVGWSRCTVRCAYQIFIATHTRTLAMGACIRYTRVTLLTPVRSLPTRHTKLPYQASMACGWKL
jgi:hypothetical protein